MTEQPLILNQVFDIGVVMLLKIRVSKIRC